MQLASLSKVHLVGIGGINMSGVAKLLARAGLRVTGSDVASSEATDELRKRGIQVMIGHSDTNLLPDTELYSSAVPEKNPERLAAAARGIEQMTNFAFLGQWLEQKRCLLVCGTHGKSTTTAMTGLLLEGAGQDPTVIVGSRVPGFADGNVRFGNSDLVVIEGDEYARHFLEFFPSGVILNNLELDHTDIFPDLEAMQEAFRELLAKVRDGGFVIANADDRNVQTLIGQERASLVARRITIRTFGFGSHADHQITDYLAKAGEQSFGLQDTSGRMYRFKLTIPGKMNVQNAAAALCMVSACGVTWTGLDAVFQRFHGIWRRFETIADREGVTVISDYGHHPTAVVATLEAAKSFYPGRRIVLVFQPHHRKRTKDFFDLFVPSFDKADALLLVEIYDVAGRDAEEDAHVSSRDLQEAVVRHDSERGLVRNVDFVMDRDQALSVVQRWKRSGDVVIVMGAGDVYKIADKIV